MGRKASAREKYELQKCEPKSILLLFFAGSLTEASGRHTFAHSSVSKSVLLGRQLSGHRWGKKPSWPALAEEQGRPDRH